MKLITTFALWLNFGQAMALDFKGLVEKASKDEKMQAQAKDLAKKGYDYFKGDKEEKKEGPSQESKEAERPKKP